MSTLEPTEDKLVRILTRVSFEEIDKRVRFTLSNQFNPELPVSKVYKIAGWKREEYHAEVKRRAANRG